MQMNSIVSNSNMTTCSLPFQFDAQANCLVITNGLSIYTPPSVNGKFKLDCEVTIKFNHYGLKISPQPIGNLAKIQLLHQNLSQSTFRIRFFDISGRLVLEKLSTGMALSYGTLINTNNLIPGIYIVQVLSANSVDLLQVIKQD